MPSLYADIGLRLDLTSTGGFMIGMVHVDFMKGVKGVVNPISWKSCKLQ